MAKGGFTFHCGTVSAGKTAHLLMKRHQIGAHHQTFLIKSSVDTRSETHLVSKIGISKQVDMIVNHKDTIDIEQITKRLTDGATIFVDEIQFFNEQQVRALAILANDFDVHVYGLKTNFKGELFEGAKAAIKYADNILFVKSECHCGRSATYNLKVVNGAPVFVGREVEIGGEETYTAVCRFHFYNAQKCG